MKLFLLNFCLKSYIKYGIQVIVTVHKYKNRISKMLFKCLFLHGNLCWIDLLCGQKTGTVVAN
jgi:hypothetical protein